MQLWEGLGGVVERRWRVDWEALVCALVWVGGIAFSIGIYWLIIWVAMEVMT